MMKPLRWKARYLTGTTAIDQKNRALVECLNGFIHAANQREHCQEIEHLFADAVTRLENSLSDGTNAGDLTDQTRTSFINALPMSSWNTPACRKCDICELAQQKITQHIAPAVQCLGVMLTN